MYSFILLYRLICRILSPVTKIILIGMISILSLMPCKKSLLRLIFHVLYRRKFFGWEDLGKEPVFYIANHVTAIDPLLILSVTPGKVAFFMHQKDVRSNFVTFWSAQLGLFDWIDADEKDAARQVQQAVNSGRSVCFFPENRLTRTNQIKMFGDEFRKMVSEGMKIRYVPTFIGGLYGSMFSLMFGGRLIMIPRRIYERPFLGFGAPMDASAEKLAVQRKVEELGVDCYKQIDRYYPILPYMLIQTCRRWGFRTMMADTLGTKISGYKFLIGVLVLRRLFHREVLKPDEKNVGVFVPMSVGGCIMNAALTFDQRVVINLNHTFGAEILDYCVHYAEIKHVISGRKMAERFPDLKLPLVCLEDYKPKITLWDKLVCMFDAIFLPAWLLRWKLGISKMKQDDVVSIIFTSGSTGRPKGVMLSHKNITYVNRGFFDAMRICEKDRMLQILPFFHGFGYVGNFWTLFLCGARGFYHFNPLESKKVGELSGKFKCSLLFCAPTFLRNFLRKCPKDNFENMNTIFCGAEKLQSDLIEAWETKYGNRPCEGYGATELSPCPIANVPDSRISLCCDDPDLSDRSKGGNSEEWFRKDGSIGRALARTTVKVIDPETGADLGVNEIGMVVARGLIQMVGYYKDPERTAQVNPNGWYVTGDIGRMDEDGFIWLTGRESRISKIGGEMVPHLLIEEKIIRFMESRMSDEIKESQNGPVCAVTSLPDKKKGERIIVLYRAVGVTPAEIRAELQRQGVANLWIPGEAGFVVVNEVPILGTGKLDLGSIKKLAEKLVPAQD